MLTGPIGLARDACIATTKAANIATRHSTKRYPLENSGTAGDRILMGSADCGPPMRCRSDGTPRRRTTWRARQVHSATATSSTQCATPSRRLASPMPSRQGWEGHRCRSTS
jgi:hypothetical protein